MNDDPTLYAISNNYHKTNVKRVVDEFGPLLNWRRDGRDSVLDVGCGNGDVTIDLVLPMLQPQLGSLIACDLSHKMIKYAETAYHHRHTNVEFERLDIRDDVDDFLAKHGTFDHVVSFYCLHWVKNHEQVLSNIRKLLAPEGDCLLMFIVSTNTFAVYDEMSKSNKWSQHMRDVERYIPAHQYVGDPVEDFQQICKSVGFAQSNIRLQETKYFFADYEEHKNFYRAVNPFIKRLPVAQQEDFIEDLTGRLIQKYKEQDYDEIVETAKIIVIHARK